MKRIIFCLFLTISTLQVAAQKPEKPSSSEIYESIKKLNFLGSVLYVAAHPDDENTQLISYFSNERKARTAYLSMTRGDGGQNLIGPELQELLGVIRTQELLAARRTDGGEQFFTRANDFGYSKHPDETLELWNKEEILKDVVSIIRRFQPDVIINRFDHRTPGTTHGQHTSSAMLSVEAFDLVGDASYKAHGLYNTWKPKRLFFNTSWWFYGSRDRFEQADKSTMLSFDTGVYYPIVGLSNNEVAALSRSQHKSQGFGSTGSRGTNLEYVEFLKGEFPTKTNNVFEGIDTTWTRVKGGKKIKDILTKVEENFDFANPSASIPELVNAYKLIDKLEDEYWKNIKLQEIKDIITACAGLFIEAVADEQTVAINSNIKVAIEAINRSNVPMVLKEISIPHQQKKISENIELKNNQPFSVNTDMYVSSEEKYTSPYWLDKKGTIGLYTVDNKRFIGNPETPKSLTIRFDVEINNTIIPIYKEVVFKYNDPVKGEVYQPLEVVTPVAATIEDKVIIFSNNASKQIPVTIETFKDNVEGTIELCYPEGWKVSPAKEAFTIASKNTKKTVVFTVTPPNGQSEGFISPLVMIEGRDYTKTLVRIDYDHIPKQTVLVPSESKVVRLDIKTKGQNIAYIQGAGDGVPTSLRQIGFTVQELDEDAITLEKLSEFNAVILGIRTYNVSDKATFYQPILHEYVKNGGTLIVQYNTNRGLKVDKVAPFELELSRDRVVEEDAKVTMLRPEHALLNFPNKITEQDFDGWIQERGLYFPNKWSSEFTPILSMNDKGEDPQQGSLLIAKYGKGNFIYTGLSFFRELPVGVSGAYKLFANMVSVGSMKIQN